ncbi:PTS sugar transporter subunit IIA [Anaerofustis stercorihominis]|uniref:PTS sugar transporter subunit IIA n=1 Tax=Anaerofustis stercorihominis TaxID=214853 RepID=A0A3E3DYX6_9FIRM|nr:PTS sugar transporter subunit IIA [Anaerofustis stercorihominis]RGD74472.1 PTS sugar transporter subunit IIA [Anaerofustis stercorihominis]
MSKEKTKLMNIEDLLYEDLVLFDVEAENSDELLTNLSDVLTKKKFVKNSFKDAIINREKVFPTGLPSPGVKVAIPHTDAEHVLNSCITIAKLKKPIKFIEMGTSSNILDIELVFMLAINAPKDQLTVLQNIMNTLSNKKLLLELKKADTSKKVIDIIKNNN